MAMTNSTFFWHLWRQSLVNPAVDPLVDCDVVSGLTHLQLSEPDPVM